MIVVSNLSSDFSSFAMRRLWIRIPSRPTASKKMFKVLHVESVDFLRSRVARNSMRDVKNGKLLLASTEKGLRWFTIRHRARWRLNF